MQRFQRFIGRNLQISRLKNTPSLTAGGVTDRYVPEELDVFEELEFGAGLWRGQDIIFTLVLERGKLARISLGYIPSGGSDDEMVAFTEAQLDDVLAEKGDLLEAFFESTVVPEGSCEQTNHNST